MPLDLATLTLVERPVTLKEGLSILDRDQYVCQYCGLDGRASFENALEMSVDFVVPRARKGKKDPRNLVACCRSCNMIKGTRVYRSFDEAKSFVLAERDRLRKAWEEKNSKPSSAARAPKTAPKPTPPSAEAPSGKTKPTASVIGSSPLSLRKS
jgi:HNH endonuclease